jgi:hypothetical protein
MNEELQKKLAGSLDKVIGAVEAGLDLAGKEAPLVVSEILNYGLMLNSVLIGVGCFILIIGLFLVRLEFSPKNKCTGLPGMFAIVCFVFSTVSIVTHFLHLMKIWLAPRLYVLDQLRNLL